MVEQMDERRNNSNQLWWQLEIKHEESGINKIQEWREKETRLMRVEMVENIELHYRMRGEQRTRARIHNRTKMKTPWTKEEAIMEK